MKILLSTYKISSPVSENSWPFLLIKSAESIWNSLDYLIGLSAKEMDTKLLKLITDLQSLSDDQQGRIVKTIQSLVKDAKANEVYG